MVSVRLADERGWLNQTSAQLPLAGKQARWSPLEEENNGDED